MVETFASCVPIRDETVQDGNDFLVTFNNARDLSFIIKMLPKKTPIAGNDCYVFPCKSNVSEEDNRDIFHETNKYET